MPSSVRAQAVGLGGIIGTVTDSSGGALPGVTVKLTSPALQLRETVIVSDAEGRYRFADLRIGVYRIEAALDGFKTTVRADIDIPADFVARLDLVMELGNINETLTVVGTSPVVDTVNTRGGLAIRSEIQSKLIPMMGGAADFARLVPGLTASPQHFNPGSSGRSGTGSPSAYGQSGTTVFVEEIQMTSNLTNGNLMDTEQVDVKTFGGTAEMWAPGVNTNFLLKSGGNQFHGHGSLLYINDRFSSSNLDDRLRAQGFAQPEQLNLLQDYRANLGGKIVQDKVWFFVSGRKFRTVKSLFGFDADVPTTNNQKSAIAKVSYQATPKYRMSGFVWRDAIFEGPIPTPGVFGGAADASLVSHSASSTYDLPSTTYSVNFQGTPRNNLTFDLKVGATAYYARYLTPSGYGFEDLPAAWDRATARYTGSGISTGNTNAAGRDGTTQFKTMLARAGVSLWRHELKAGWDLQYITSGARSKERPTPPGNYILVFDTVGGVPHQPVEIQTLSLPTDGSRNTAINNALYVADQWQALPRVVVNLGLRLEVQANHIPPQSRPAAQFAVAGELPGVDFRPLYTPAPRVAIAWDLNGSGRTVLKSTWGRFNVQYMPQATSQFSDFWNPNSTTQTNYRWRDLNGNLDYDPGEVDLRRTGGNDFLSSTGGQVNAYPLSDEYYVPYTYEFTTSIERELLPLMSGRFLYVRKVAIGGLTASYDTMTPDRPYSAYNIPLQRRDPGPDGITGNADDGSMVTIYDYDPAYRGGAFNRLARVNRSRDRSDIANAFEVSINKRASDRWSMGTGVNLVKQHRYLTGIVASPNDEAFDLDNTWTKEFRLNGSLTLPWDVTVGGALNVQSGLKRQRTNVFRAADPLGGTPLRQLTTVTLRLEEYGAQTGPVQKFLSVRVGKTIRLARGMSIGLNLDALNALNSNAYYRITDVSGPTYGTITGIPIPRAIQFGSTFTF